MTGSRRRVCIVGLVVLWAVGLPSAAAPPHQETQSGDGTAASAEDLMGVGDVLSVSVWNEPELTKPIIIVRPDGKISFPLMGDVEAAGKTPRQLAQTLAAGLARFIKEPVVVVRDKAGREVRSELDHRTRSIYLKPGETIRVP